MSNIQASKNPTFPLDNMSDEKKVLVIGGEHVGTTEFINSIDLALTDADKEKLGPSTKNFTLRPATIYKRIKVQKSKNPTHIVFYEAFGFEHMKDQCKLATILRFLLEGKLKPSEFHWSLIQQENFLRKHFKNIEVRSTKAFSAIIYLENEYDDAETVKISSLITKAINRSDKQTVKKIPVIRCFLNGEKDCITSDLKSSLSADDSNVTSKNDFGLPKHRFNLDSYSWIDGYTDIDIENEDLPAGYLQCQQEELDRCKQEQLNKQMSKAKDKIEALGNVLEEGEESEEEQEKKSIEEVFSSDIEEDTCTINSTEPPLFHLTSSPKSSSKNSTSKMPPIIDINELEGTDDVDNDDSGVTLRIHSDNTPGPSNISHMNKNLAKALVDSPLPSIKNLNMIMQQSNSNSPNGSGVNTPKTQNDLTSSVNSRCSSFSKSSRRLSTPEISFNPSILKQQSVPSEISDHPLHQDFSIYRDKSVSSNFIKSASLSALQNIAPNQEPSDRFEFNYRVKPTSDLKKTVSLLLFLEKVLEMIYYGHESALCFLWRVDRQQVQRFIDNENRLISSSSNDNNGSSMAGLPLGNLLKSLIGKGQRQQRSRVGRTN